jgi:phosphopentomutase
MNVKRVVILVLDGLGVGALPDAHLYGDEGTNTLGHILSASPGYTLPGLVSLGLGELVDPPLETTSQIRGAHGKMAQRSSGKDTISGHWELAGVPLDRPFPVYPHGFPDEVISLFEAYVGKPVLGNVAASGTEIINRLGELHLETGRPIVYTSADSVFQVAAHEDVVPVETLYGWCMKARREILLGKHAVGRVIARPFQGSAGHFFRTENRKDFSLPPPAPTLLDAVSQAGLEVWVVGKVYDIFSGQGITRHQQDRGNKAIMRSLMECIEQPFEGVMWATLVDFDMLYGHRNDAEGFLGALEVFDQFLRLFLRRLLEEDVLFITADHGCDPTFAGTDHTREYVPLLVYGRQVKARSLGTRKSFADLGATVADLLGVAASLEGNSFARDLT